MHVAIIRGKCRTLISSQASVFFLGGDVTKAETVCRTGRVREKSVGSALRNHASACVMWGCSVSKLQIEGLSDKVTLSSTMYYTEGNVAISLI